MLHLSHIGLLRVTISKALEDNHTPLLLEPDVNAASLHALPSIRAPFQHYLFTRSRFLSAQQEQIKYAGTDGSD